MNTRDALLIEEKRQCFYDGWCYGKRTARRGSFDPDPSHCDADWDEYLQTLVRDNPRLRDVPGLKAAFRAGWKSHIRFIRRPGYKRVEASELDLCWQDYKAGRL